MPPIPDYSHFELKQLYDVIRCGDLRRFPERLAAVKREIELKGGDPDAVKTPSFWVTGREITLALWLVRFLVAVEYTLGLLGAGYFGFLVSQYMGGHYGAAALVTSIVLVIYAHFCMVGVNIMFGFMDKVRNRSAVETAWLGALGLAPLSAVVYVVMGAALMDILFSPSNDIELILFAFVGFYLPFVLLGCLVKYRCRDDEF